MYSAPFEVTSRRQALEWLDMKVLVGQQSVGTLPRQYETPPAWEPNTKELRSNILGHTHIVCYVKCCTHMLRALRKCCWQLRYFRDVIHTSP